MSLPMKALPIQGFGLTTFISSCLLKRRLKGTYVSVEPFHLFRYLDEQSWPF